MKISRVVTSHDDKGKAVVAIDEVSRDVVSFRPGATVANIWSTAGFPVDNNGLRDTAKEITATTRAGGTVFRVIEFAPGVAPRNHRTDSIDYAVVLAGEIDMTLDDQVVTLRAGDVLVQRGTIHNWINRSAAPCVIAFVLIDAKPVEHDGKPLRGARLAFSRHRRNNFPGSQYGEDTADRYNHGVRRGQYRSASPDRDPHVPADRQPPGLLRHHFRAGRLAHRWHRVRADHLHLGRRRQSRPPRPCRQGQQPLGLRLRRAVHALT